MDCIYGYGLNRDLDEESIDLVCQINLLELLYFHLPSGLDPMTGRMCPICVKCDTLIALLTHKRGAFTNEGRDTWNEIYLSNLIQNPLKSKNYLISATDTSGSPNFSKNFTVKESFSQHKKSRGVSCVISGEQPYHGAMILSVTALIKLGCHIFMYTQIKNMHIHCQ